MDILRILFHIKNSYTLKPVIKKVVTFLIPKECAKLIRDGAYHELYDINSDGFLNSYDYNIIYNRFYGKWDAWHSNQMGINKSFDVRDIVKIKNLSGKSPDANDNIYSDYDLDNDSAVTDTDVNIMRYWMVVNYKEPRENFNENM